jgi:hypothetical protein
VRRLGRADLETLRLVTPEQGRKVPTVGGMLLFGLDRERHFPDAWIQAGRFRGTDKSRIDDRAEIRSLPVWCHTTGGTTVPGIRIEAEWLGDHAEEGVDQANDLGPKLVGHEPKEDAGPRRTRSVDPPEFAVEHAQRFCHGRFAAEPTNRLRDLRESPVLEDVEEIVRVLVGPAPGEGQGLQDDVGSRTAHEHVS